MKSRLFMKLTALFVLLLFASVLLSGAKKEKFAGKVKSEGVVLDTENLTISVVNFLKNAIAGRGNDGVSVLCPEGWLTKQGRGGRLVSYPPGWRVKEGRDGKVIAYPPTWTTRAGKDGRIVAHPYGWMYSEGKDGRVVARPYGWMYSEGKDGRAVARPYGWMYSEGKDGRVIARPYGWMYSEGKDGRVVAHPYGWTHSEGKDGRVVGRPYGSQSGIKRNGRLLTYSDTRAEHLTLIFPNLEKNALFEELKKHLTGKALFDYIQYVYLNEYVSTSRATSSRPSAQIAPPDGSVHSVLKVIDGDTIDIDTVEGPLRVRVVGIDTPETVHPSKPVEFWGPEASYRAKQLLTGQAIRIHYDTLPNSQRWDNNRYRRLLAYVELANGYDFGLIMVSEGHAKVYTRFPFFRESLYLEAEQAARNQRLGVWSK